MDTEKLVDVEHDERCVDPPPYSQTAGNASASTSQASGWTDQPPTYSADGKFLGPDTTQQPVAATAAYPQSTIGPVYNYVQQPSQQQMSTVIVQQPLAQSFYVSPSLQSPPEDYMGYSIFVTLCCCWLIGIFAILKSSECRSAIASGDRVTAETRSREARRMANLALGLGILSMIVTGVIIGIYYGLMVSRYGHD